MHVVVVEIEAFLGPSARCKWEDTPRDIQAGLRRAFDDAIQRPEKVHRHHYETRRFGRRVRKWVAVHSVEIGFATFVIADVEGSPLILDFDYADTVEAPG